MDTDLMGALLKLVQHRDEATAAHTWRVGLYTLALAEAVGVDPAEYPRHMRAAVLHDIGKIDIPRRIVAKAGELTPEEYRVLQAHPRLGYERLVRLGERDRVVLDVVLWHHERLDGTGYPDGLEGEEIPVAARRFAVIDAFDAMTSLRPYRDDVGAPAAGRALEELGGRAGTWYCPDSVAALDRLYRSGELDWILHHLNDEHSLVELPAVPDAASITAARAAVDARIARTARGGGGSSA